MASAPEKPAAAAATPPAAPPSDSAASPPIDDATTGVPFFRTWNGVYWFVAACFVAYVILLAALPRVFA